MSVIVGEIKRFHVTSLLSRLRRKTENSRHVGVQRDTSFNGDLHEMSIMLLICVEIPLMLRLKQLYKRLYLCFFYQYHMCTYCTSCTSRWQFISSLQNCDGVMKTLYYKPGS